MAYWWCKDFQRLELFLRGKMMNIRWIRWIIVITIICTAILIAGYRLTQMEPEAAAAAPAFPISSPVKDVSLNAQATTIEEVEARGMQTVVEQTIVFADEQFGYHLSYPVEWEVTRLSANVVLFHAIDGVTKVKVESAGLLPPDGLSPFVDRSLFNEVVMSRQSLTVHGYPAERIVTFADNPGGQVTTFYIEADASAYVITGIGQQSAIEKIARSFNAPQVVAQW
jgi:hypothetical protein